MLERIVALATLVYSREALTDQFATNQIRQKAKARMAVSRSVRGSRGWGTFVERLSGENSGRGEEEVCSSSLARGWYSIEDLSTVKDFVVISFRDHHLRIRNGIR
jgi:hypothetical protein